MSYFTDLFTVETYQAFLASDRTASGFRETQQSMASRVKSGDKLLVYIKGLSRWTAVLEVRDGPTVDRKPIFLPEDDPFVVRFHIYAEVCLSLEQGVPVKDEEIFSALSFTKGREDGYWLGPLRRSLQHIEDDDGRFLESIIKRQASKPKPYPLDDSELDLLKTQVIKRAEGSVVVTVPVDDAEQTTAKNKADRDSIKIQAELARLGEAMGFRIWVPKNDRAAVCHHWHATNGSLLETLPINYDDTTLKTIEQIDILWLKGRAIQRAFEVEHTTSIYSGLLRMADLLALQPNMNIALHIVAPVERRDKVLSEIRRPVFSLIEHQPLAKRCSYLAYENLREIMELKHLSHTSDSVLEEYEEYAGE